MCLFQRYDVSQVRPAGAPIRGFGGTASGPGPLLSVRARWPAQTRAVRVLTIATGQLLESIEATLRALTGRPITVTAITDLMNLIGKCVVSGNVRRTAEIAFGDPDLDEYLDLKVACVLYRTCASC